MDVGERYYRHSGEFDVRSVAIMLVAGGATGLVGGLAYGYADAYIPFVYIVFLLTAGVGGITGYVTALCAKSGKVRNCTVTGIVGGLTGLMALYAAWVAWIHAISGFTALVFSPAGIFRAMLFVTRKGAWDISDFTPKGALLFTVWAVEAAVVIGLSAWVAATHLSNWPFCERCQAWTDPSKGFGPFERIAAPEELRSRLEREDYAALDELVVAKGDPQEFASAELWACPVCGEMAYLTLTNVKITTEKKGKTEEQKTETADVVRTLMVPSDVGGRLARAGEKVGVATQEGSQMPPEAS